MAEYDLKKSIAKIGSHRMNAALYKGAKDSQVLITPKPAESKLVTEIEKTCGETKRVFKGVCFFEGEKLVFATKAPPAPTWETMVTKVLKDHHCSEYLPAEVRQLREDESDEAQEEEGGEGAPVAPPQGESADAATAFSARLRALLPELAKAIATGKPAGLEAKQRAGEAGNAAKAHDFDQANALLDATQKLIATALGAATPPPAPPPPTGTAQEQWTKLKAAMTPKISTAVGANPPNKAAILEKLKAALDKEKAGDFAGAIELFKQLAGLLPGSAPTAPPPPVTPPPVQAPHPPDGAQLTLALQKLTPTIQQAVTAHPDRKGDIAAKLTAFRQLLQAGKFAEAKEALSAMVQLLRSLDQPATPAPTPVPETPAGTAPPEEPEDEQEEDEIADEEVPGTIQESDEEWQKAFAIIEPRYLEIMRGQPTEATRLRAMMGGASDLAGDGKYGEALKSLLKLEEALDNLADDAGDATTGYAGLVAYRKSLLAYNAAYQAVTSQIEALKAAIPAQLPTEAELATKLAEELQHLNEDVRDSVDEAMNVAGDAASPVTKELSDALAGYLADVRSSPLVRHADNSPFGPTMTIATTLGNALAAIRAAMPKAA